jgi:NAD(P)-dependent dehydrogenase (short-subunit alcohol dehydrogenase family)
MEVVVVTGASAGVGRATVRLLAREGATVGLIARGGERLEALHIANVLELARASGPAGPPAGRPEEAVPELLQL